jgi:hypothetical protein
MICVIRFDSYRTDASNDPVAATLFDSPIPSSNGPEVTFEQWQFGGDPAFPPADGISFFLTDGEQELTARSVRGQPRVRTKNSPTMIRPIRSRLASTMAISESAWTCWATTSATGSTVGTDASSAHPQARSSAFRPRARTW